MSARTLLVAGKVTASQDLPVYRAAVAQAERELAAAQLRYDTAVLALVQAIQLRAASAATEVRA